MLILASASPRRAQLLRAAGIAFDVVAADVDETALPGEAPEMHVRRLAEVKANAVAARYPDATILGADTVVVIDDRILGKPRDFDTAAGMLRALSGRSHEVLTGVSVVTAGRKAVEVARTRVRFSCLTDPQIRWYIGTGEAVDKAGAYAIQGLASRFVERIDGSYCNVVGLPVALVYRMLEAVS
jgi:septum formation protein